MADHESLPRGYIHGFTETEQERLLRQARFLEHRIHDRLPYQRSEHLLEVGCGVGAQTEILLRHYPKLRVTGVELAEANIAKARKHLASVPGAEGRYTLVQADASRLDFAADEFDAAYLSWILEHVADPASVLAEVRRVLKPGSPIVVTEVQNATFFVDPYSPHTMAYWLAFNDHQIELGGDPFVGAKLGNLLQAGGYRDIVTDVRHILLDNRTPGERAEFLDYWIELLLSDSDELQQAGKVSRETVDGMKEELSLVGRDPNSVFFYSFVQARALVW